MADQTHDGNTDILRRLDNLERKLEELPYVTPTLLASEMRGIRGDIRSIREDVIGGIRADVIDLQAAEQQRKTQMYTVIGALVVLLVGGLLQSGVFG